MLTPKGTTGINENHECFIALSLLSFYFIAERASGAPLLSKFGNLMMRQILVVTSACARPPYKPWGRARGVPRHPDGGGECHLFLAEIARCFWGGGFCVCVVAVVVVVVVVVAEQRRGLMHFLYSIRAFSEIKSVSTNQKKRMELRF